MKTMHHDNYWSAHPIENRVPYEVDGKNYLDHNKFHNNCFCLFPDRTAEFVERATVPVMGFKVLAAGAIEPRDGFNWAFEKGADGVYAVGCMEGDCHYNSGNFRARKRVEQAQGILDTIGVGGERVQMFNLASSEGPLFAKIAGEMTQRIRDLGPNPIKLAAKQAA